jgi:WD40 repeat protein
LALVPQFSWPETDRSALDDYQIATNGRCAYLTKDSQIVLWEPATRRRVSWVWQVGQPTAISISADGKLLAAASGTNLVVWNWNLDRQSQLATFEKAKSEAQTLCFSADRQFIAAGNWDGTIEVWVIDRKERILPWQAHSLPITDLAFTPDGRRIVSVSNDARATLWDIRTRGAVMHFARTLNTFNSVTVSPDGTRIAAATDNRSIQVFNAATGRIVATLPTGDPKDPESLTFTQDGMTILIVKGNEVRAFRAPAVSFPLAP